MSKQELPVAGESLHLDFSLLSTKQHIWPRGNRHCASQKNTHTQGLVSGPPPLFALQAKAVSSVSFQTDN